MAEQDRIAAELQYVSQRTEELGREMREAEKAYGGPVNDDNVDGVVDELTNAVRRSGNVELANRYTAAFHRFMSAGRAARAAIGRNDEDTGDKLCEAMNEAQEDFERIQSEVATWLDYAIDERKPS